ncbi:TniQ family protein [Streptomyces sp. NPDC006638]|uniref:TniQ family protein n=1 Tax=Streptomyces sp. NPDC006638 TaxID=3157183 RepID=UPI0033BD54AA
MPAVRWSVRWRIWPMRARYGPLNLDVMRRDDLAYLAVHNPWVLTASSRYCPECLAGDGSTLQEGLGGSWHRLWRLASVFACLEHRRMLIHERPGCRHTRSMPTCNAL